MSIEYPAIRCETCANWKAPRILKEDRAVAECHLNFVDDAPGRVPSLTRWNDYCGGWRMADLDLPNADERLVKAEMALRISRGIRARGLTQAEAARFLGVSRDSAGQLLRGQLAAFSIEQLRRILALVAPF